MAATGRRYAQAAFEIATENDNLARWEEDLAKVAEVLADEDVISFLAAPQVSGAVKLDGIGKLLADVDPLVKRGEPDDGKP